MLHSCQPMPLLTLGYEVSGENQVVDDAAGIGPHAKQVVALEEAVVSVSSMRDHQSLHGGGVFFHQVADARVRVDDDLVGQPHMASSVTPLRGQILLAVAPVAVAYRHAAAGVGIHHLFSRNHFQLIGIGVQAEPLSHCSNGRVILLDQFKGPVTGVWQGLPRPLASRQRGRGHATLYAIACSAQLPGRTAFTPRQYRILSKVHTETPSFLKRSRNTG